MADWHVKPSGDDTNNGATAETALKSVSFAEAVASPADTIFISGTAKNAPLRNNQITHNSALLANHLVVSSAINLRGLSTQQYIAGSVDITDGESRGDYIIDPSFSAWPSANSLHFWGIETGTIEKETTEVATGYNASIHTPVGAGTGSFSGVKLNVRLPKNTTFAVEAIARNVEISTRTIVTITDTNAAESVDFSPASASTWGAAVTDNYIGSAGANVFEDFTDNFPSPYNQFTTQNTDTYDITLQNNGGADRESYMQLLSITNVDHPNYSWVADAETDVYYMPAMHFQPKIVLVTPTADWTVNGFDGFDDTNANYGMKASQAAMNAAEESAWWDSTNDRVYIHIPSGSSISDFHIEACTNSPVIEYTDDAVVENITCSGGRGTLVSAGVTNGITGYSLNNINCVFDAVKCNAGADNKLYSSISKRNRGDFGVSTDTDGFLAVNAGTKLTVYGGTAKDVLDDGFEGSNGGYIVCYGSLADGAGAEGEPASLGFKISLDAGNNAEFYRCTAINCTGGGFKNELTGAGLFRMKECIAKNNTGGDVNINATGTVTYDIDECIAETVADGSGEWAGGTNNQTLTNANIKLNADGSLQEDFTEAIGTAANEPGADAWIVGANGNVYGNVNRDKGGMPSTFSPTHPKNT